MNVRSRIAELENAAGDGPPCDVCGGKVRLAPMVLRGAGEPGPTERPARGPCPACGRMPRVVRLRPMTLAGGKKL